MSKAPGSKRSLPEDHYRQHSRIELVGVRLAFKSQAHSKWPLDLSTDLAQPDQNGSEVIATSLPDENYEPLYVS